MAIGEFRGKAAVRHSARQGNLYQGAVTAHAIFSNEGRHTEALSGILDTAYSAYRDGMYNTAAEHFALAAVSAHNLVAESGDNPNRELMKQEIEALAKAQVAYERAQHFAKDPNEAAHDASMTDSLKNQLHKKVLEYAGAPQLDLLNGTADHLDTRRVSADVEWLVSRVIRRFQRELGSLLPLEVRNSTGAERDRYSAAVSEMLTSSDSSERLAAIRSAGVGSLTPEEMRTAMSDPLPLIRIMVAREPSVPFEILVDRMRIEKDKIVKAAIEAAIESRRKSNMHLAAKKAVEAGLIKPLPITLVRTDAPILYSAPAPGSVHAEKARKRNARNARIKGQVKSGKLNVLTDY